MPKDADYSSAWEYCYKESIDEAHSPSDVSNRSSPLTPPTATDIVDYYAFLPMLVSIVVHERKGQKVRVLDYGGGVGNEYVHLLSTLPEVAIDYHILELQWACQAGEALFADDDRIHFHTSLPSGLSQLGIVHMNSSLQYVEDYVGILRALCAYRAEYFLIVRTNFGDFPSFATAQTNLPGATVPCWFFNREEIVDILRQEGYSLIFKAAISETFDQDNLPEGYRGQPSCLLFAHLPRS